MSSCSVEFASALSTHADTTAAIDDVCDQAFDALGSSADLAIVFFSADHGPGMSESVPRLHERLAGATLAGCSAESVVGGGTEVEVEPAVALWLARFPDIQFHPLRLSWQPTPEGGSFVGWPDELPPQWPSGGALIVFGDPFSFPVDGLLDLVNQEQPGIPVLGGMASAAQSPGGNQLVLDDAVLDSGAVAVLLYGGSPIRSLVSQGCRPIGQHFVVTKAEQNVIYELGGEPAYRRLEEVFVRLPTRDQQLLQQGVHLGRVVSEYQDHFQQGDFLVRNLVGVDREQGAIAIGDYLRPGQTVQFHVRDAETADAELQQLLARAKAESAPRAALLFTCNGRGTRLFPEPHHDASVIQAALGSIPVAGFFAAGEMGPIGGTNFLHGFTASMALFD